MGSIKPYEQLTKRVLYYIIATRELPKSQFEGAENDSDCTYQLECL